MTIGRKINELRKKQNMSVEELASKLGKNRATVYRYERGDIESLPLDMLEPLAKALNTTPAYLMDWEDKPNNDTATVGELLKIIRTQHHMTIEEFSKEIGITPEDLRKYESGEKHIPIETINIIADYYRLSMNSFTNGQKNISNEENIRLERFKVWAESFGHMDFTDEEHDKILEYARFLIYIREK